MKKYKVVQLYDGITQPQGKEFSDILNEGYYIFAEYKFPTNVIIVLKLEENDGEPETTT